MEREEKIEFENTIKKLEDKLEIMSENQKNMIKGLNNIISNQKFVLTTIKELQDKNQLEFSKLNQQLKCNEVEIDKIYTELIKDVIFIERRHNR